MRISTQQFYKQNTQSMTYAQGKMLESQVNITTGKKIHKPSDDPVASARIALLENRLERTERFSKNAAFANDTLTIQDSNMKVAGDIVLRLKELQIRAGGVIDAAGKQAIASEAQQMLEQFVAMANTKDSNGKYIYGGAQSLTTPVTLGNGQYQYNGDQNQKEINISAGLKIPTSDSGYDIFMNIANGNGDFSLSASSGTGNVESIKVSNRNLYLSNIDQYQVTIDGTGTGYIVTDSSGQTVANGTAYTDGDPIEFNGIELVLNGTSPSSSFTFQPKARESVYDTIQRMITNLQLSDQVPGNSEIIQQENENISAQLEQLYNHFTQRRTIIGSRLQSIDRAEQTNEEIKFSATSTISLLEDTDILEAATTLNGFTIALQAAQQSFSKIQSLSLFNYL